MRYWKKIDSNRVIAVIDICEMSALNWVEITKEKFDELVLLRNIL